MRHTQLSPGWTAVLTLLTILVLANPITSFAQTDGELLLAPENPAFLDYIEGPNDTLQSAAADEFPAGLIPEPFVLPQPAPGVFKADAVLPASYDLRSQNKLTPIRDQGSCGSCWAFASIGSLESALMPGESWNISENNLKNRHGFDISCCSGGNRTMSTAYLARWAGPIAEVDDPYNPSSCASPVGVAPVKHVQQVIYVPNRTGFLDNDSIKQAIITYGAVYTSYYHSNSYYNSSTASYYYSGGSYANHAVCIVGWDDNYSASRFLSRPPGDGAFLIRNSWGTWWGSGGYFWMSYYDSRLGKSENAVFLAEPAEGYSAIYQYDDLGWISNMGYGGQTAWFANVFTATSSDPIAAASWYAAAQNSSYELYVYVNPTSGPVGGSPAAVKSGSITYAGYHTIRLDAPVPVTAGQRFSVVVKITTPGYMYPVPIERPYSGYAGAARASSGQSYVSSSGSSWNDIALSYSNTNVCLKAFASRSSAPSPGALSVTPSTALSSTGEAGGPFSPVAQSYTLTNTGDSSINWTASKTQSWTNISSTGGILAKGATATVTVSINSTANSLAAGNYADTVTFANATNGNGGGVRSVSLNVAGSTPDPGALSVSPSTNLSASGTAGGPFSPTSQSYTLTNTGESSISWTASRKQSWTSLSSTGGTLAKGATATVTVSINSAANALAVGSYSDTVTFTNATNGSGNTSRSVSLTVNSSGTSTGTYRIMPASFDWVDPSAHTRLSLGDNSVSPAISLPFGFTFYGKTYSRVYISSNGIIGFGTTGMTYYTNSDLPRTFVPNATICAYWDNLNPARGGYVSFGVEGTAPNRKLVVSWVDVAWQTSSTVKFTLQAVLHEGTNDIVLQYLDVSPNSTYYGAGKSATIGIENETGKLACKHSYNTYGAVSNNSAIRITTY